MNHTSHDPAQLEAGQLNSHPPTDTASTSTADTGDGPTTDTGSAPGPEPVPPAPEGGGPGHPGGPFPPPAGRPGRDKRPIIAGLVAVAVIATVAVGLRGGGGDDGDTGDTGSAGGAASGQAGSDATDLPSNAGTVQTADDDGGLYESGTPELEVVDEGFSSFDTGQGGIEGSWAFVVENSGDGAANALPVDVVFKDAAGATLATESHVLKHVPAGGETGFGREFLAGDLSGDIASMEITLGEPSTLDSPYDEGEYTISGVTVAPAGDSFGGWRAVFTIDSTHEETMKNADLYAVFRGADGKIVGGAFTTMSTITPGSSAGEITSYGDVPGVESADIYLVGG